MISALEEPIRPDKSATDAKPTKVRKGPVQSQSDHSRRRGSAVCIRDIARLSARRRVLTETGFAPTHLPPDDRDGHMSDEGHAAQGRESRKSLLFLHHAPNDLGAETSAPDSTSFVDRSKQNAICDSGCRHP